MYEKGVLNSRGERVFSRIPHQVLYFEVFSRISRVFFFFCQSCLRMVWSLEVYKYWIGPLGELRVARDGPGIRTSSRKLLLADRTCPYNSYLNVYICQRKHMSHFTIGDWVNAFFPLT